MADPVAAPLGGLGHAQLKDRVYAYLREAIIAGEFPVGSALRENDITARLGVSKTPVREAFVRLEKDRLLELIPYKGAVVAGYTDDDLREFYELRELVEGACARMAALNCTDEFLARLTANVAGSEEACESSDHAAVVSYFEEFDELVYGQSTNRWVDDLVEHIDGHQRRIGRLTIEIPGRITRSVEQHRAVADAIGRGDADAAERLMRDHVRSVLVDQLSAADD